MSLEVGQEILADDINRLKERVKAEIKRRQKDDSLKIYDSDNQEYEITPDINVEVITEHYNKIAKPILAINNKSKSVTTEVTLPAEVNENDLIKSISLLEKLLTDFEKQIEYTATDCVAACTGLCTQECSGTCKNGCEENCAKECYGACGGGCASKCTTTCRNDCQTVCGDGCSGGCGGNCSGDCVGSCNTRCTGCRGCSSTCSGGCKTTCVGSCKGNYCERACERTCSVTGPIFG